MPVNIFDRVLLIFVWGGEGTMACLVSFSPFSSLMCLHPWPIERNSHNNEEMTVAKAHIYLG